MKPLVPSAGGTYNYTPLTKTPTAPPAGENEVTRACVSLQVPGVLLPHGPGVLLCRPAASQTGAVRNEGGDQDVEGARRGHPGSRQIQGQSAGDDSHRVG